MDERSLPPVDRVNHTSPVFRKESKQEDPRRVVDGKIVTFREELEMALEKNNADKVKELRKNKPR